MGRRRQKAIIFIDLTLLSDEESAAESEKYDAKSLEEEKTPFSPPLNIHGNLLTSQHYRILQTPSAWFNDDLINGYFCKLRESCEGKVFVFSSFFYSSLLRMGKEFCSRHSVPKSFKHFTATEGTDKIVLFPVNSGASHWVLVAWHISKGTLEYYDSMMCRRSGKVIMKNISEFFNTEMDADPLDKLESSLNNLNLEEKSAQKLTDFIPKIDKFQIPKGQMQQTDGSSCGPFCCLFAKNLVEGPEDIFDIYEFRRSLIEFFLEK